VDAAGQVLSRAALLSELSSKNLVALAYPAVQQLYHLLEKDFQPLALCQKVAPLLTQLGQLTPSFSSSNSPLPEADLSMYSPALERLCILRTLQQVSQVRGAQDSRATMGGEGRAHLWVTGPIWSACGHEVVGVCVCVWRMTTKSVNSAIPNGFGHSEMKSRCVLSDSWV
jgi:hypothetical protein